MNYLRLFFVLCIPLVMSRSAHCGDDTPKTTDLLHLIVKCQNSGGRLSADDARIVEMALLDSDPRWSLEELRLAYYYSRYLMSTHKTQEVADRQLTLASRAHASFPGVVSEELLYFGLIQAMSDPNDAMFGRRLIDYAYYLGGIILAPDEKLYEHLLPGMKDADPLRSAAEIRRLREIAGRNVKVCADGFQGWARQHPNSSALRLANEMRFLGQPLILDSSAEVALSSGLAANGVAISGSGDVSSSAVSGDAKEIGDSDVVTMYRSIRSKRCFDESLLNRAYKRIGDDSLAFPGESDRGQTKVSDVCRILLWMVLTGVRTDDVSSIDVDEIRLLSSTALESGWETLIKERLLWSVEELCNGTHDDKDGQAISLIKYYFIFDLGYTYYHDMLSEPLPEVRDQMLAMLNRYLREPWSNWRTVSSPDRRKMVELVKDYMRVDMMIRDEIKKELAILPELKAKYPEVFEFADRQYPELMKSPDGRRKAFEWLKSNEKTWSDMYLFKYSLKREMDRLETELGNAD